MAIVTLLRDGPVLGEPGYVRVTDAPAGFRIATGNDAFDGTIAGGYPIAQHTQIRVHTPQHDPRHSALLVYRRKFGDAFRKTLWVRCWFCDLEVGPYDARRHVEAAKAELHEQLSAPCAGDRRRLHDETTRCVLA